MFNNSIDINRFLGETSLTEQSLEFLLNEPTPIQDNDEKSFFELPVNENYKKQQEINKKQKEILDGVRELHDKATEKQKGLQRQRTISLVDLEIDVKDFLKNQYDNDDDNTINISER